MKKKYWSILFFVLAMSILTACGSSDSSSGNPESEPTEEKKVLTVGTSADYPPFEYVDSEKSDEIIGFDIDLLNAIASKLGYEVNVVDMDFGSLIPGLQAGKMDLIMAGMTQNEERMEVVDFSVPYYESAQMLVTKKDSKIEKLEDLEGLTVGAQISSTQELAAKKIQETIDIQVESRNRIPEIVQEIKSNRFDVAVIEEVVSNELISQNPDLKSLDLLEEHNLQVSAVFSKGSKLKTEFDEVIEEMLENGEIEKLKQKWFANNSTE